MTVGICTFIRYSKSMERLRFADKRILLIIAVLFLVGIVSNLIPVRHFVPHHISAFCYVILIMIWAMTLRRRLLDAEVSRRILMICFFMLLLFFLRMCKFSFFTGIDVINEHLWYAYYIPMTAMPLFGFMASLRIEPVGDKKAVKALETGLMIAELLICTVIMTNRFHSQLFAIKVLPDKEYTRGWFYFLVIGWMAVLGLGSLFLMIRKCTLSSARKLWFIPLLFILLGFVLLAWYLKAGGSPVLNGCKLFHMQEAYCLPFITAFESLIFIGVIPANSGYEALFDLSGINAAIYDKLKKPVLHSRNWTADAGDEDHRIRREAVSGGSVSWVEDLSSIHRLNRELEEVAEELEDENELIRQENEIRAERVSYETKNRLYNSIASAVRPQAIRVQELLSGEPEDEEGFRSRLIYAAVLSAYIKRMGNLMLLTEGENVLPCGELMLAFGESMEYIRLKGSECELRKKGDGMIPAGLGLLAYELFQAAIEDVWSRFHTCAVELVTDPFSLTILLDANAEALSGAWNTEKLREDGGKVSVRFEDDTCYIRLLQEKEGR
ncbi:MAG: hypothetical protein IK115_05765 [Lachnospiraceae bacterium]|nr:hypothetical protein [Lachnospiraceae bacterium]